MIDGSGSRLPDLRQVSIGQDREDVNSVCQTRCRIFRMDRRVQLLCPCQYGGARGEIENENGQNRPQPSFRALRCIQRGDWRGECVLLDKVYAGDGDSRPGTSRQGRLTQSKSRLGPSGWPQVLLAGKRFSPDRLIGTTRSPLITEGRLCRQPFRNSPPRRSEMSTPRAAAAASRAIRIQDRTPAHRKRGIK